ncbi:hypothetical protein B0T11DRAFT_298889 [Plectosphaerella cucumerina]|uniref:Chromo domain-containing protein n=1 Tax=Plectosphaerella cucumerina TaxID=40658 RepID=A0A8K0X4E2_9PEZI|nr:hypothetical protein B0T11DRAFT_298889 [Plectosphaerella cucumerina]
MTVATGDLNIMAKEAGDIAQCDEIVGREERNFPPPPCIGDRHEASASQEHLAQVMGDSDNIVHGHAGDSSATDRDGEESESDIVAGDGDWEITDVVGKEIIHGTVHYLVQWKPTLVSANEINAPELIGDFESKFGTPQTQSVLGGRIQKKPSSKMGGHGREANRRGRGRPRKEVSRH